MKTEDISAVVNMKFPINLAYLTEYFTDDELHNLTADSMLNDKIEIFLPKLAVADKLPDKNFAHEKAAAFDLELVINSTKTSAVVYDDLARYLFNE